MAQVVLDRETFKALAGETRIQIMKELNERRKTQSELAARLHLSSPTVNEHLLLLKHAGLVEEIDDGHKWKYFSLTRKGKNVLNPGEVQILLVLSVLCVAFTALILLFYFQNFSFAGSTAVVADRAPELLANATAQKSVSGASACVSNEAAKATASKLPLGEITLLVILAAAIGLFTGYLLKKKQTG